MAYQRDENYSEQKQKGDPHPDAQRNLEYALKALNCIETLDTMSYTYYDTNEQNIISHAKYVGFNWKEGKYNMGDAISFHQPSQDFMEVLDRTIKWHIAKRRFMKKAGATGAFY